MKSRLSLVFLVIAVSLLVTTPALAGGPYTSTYCASIGGTWSGLGSVDGQCKWAANTATAIAACGADQDYTVLVSAGHSFSSSCTTPASSSPDPVSDEDQSHPEDQATDGGSEGPVTLTLGGDKNGSVTFPPETCPQKCTISSKLPSEAKQHLPSNALATMYVRVIDAGGNPGNGSYQVCFNNAKNEAVVIYRFVSGAWVGMAASSGSQICTTANGEGSFYLGN